MITADESQWASRNPNSAVSSGPLAGGGVLLPHCSTTDNIREIGSRRKINGTQSEGSH